MLTFEYDLRYLQAGVEQLENYLLAKDLYWPVGVSAPAGGTPYPQLTIGGLLLAQARLHATSQSRDQQAAFYKVELLLDEIRRRWSVAWEKKARQDYHARLNLWRDFLEDYRDNPVANFDRYPYEVGRRVQLRLLSDEVEELPPAELELLDGLDRLLRSVFIPGRFAWEEELITAFPAENYWFLYGAIRKEPK